MLNSRDISLLRSDVAANCQIFLDLCKSRGLPVLVTGTVRDDEFQQQCYERGTGGKPPATFHSVKAGLAFDVCKNVRGQEYSDENFWKQVGAIGQTVGFSWGYALWGYDKPHFQWDANGRYGNADIRSGKYPPTMPRYAPPATKAASPAPSNETPPNSESVSAALARLWAEETAATAAAPPSDWAKQAWALARQAGILDGTAPRAALTREQFALVLLRLGLLPEKEAPSS